MIVYRSTYTNSGHVDHLSVTTRGAFLEKVHDEARFIPLVHYKEIQETWEQIKDVITPYEMSLQLGIPEDAFIRIIEKDLTPKDK